MTPRFPDREQLDPFSRERFPEIAQRLTKMRMEQQRRENALWMGSLALSFDDLELGILATMGFLSDQDRIGMARMGRPVRPVPLLNEPYMKAGASS